ncbi:LPXTG cell wall anchor domain-containing protein [Vagococcus sp. BWB3-3]|uniref:LPXTG cell wall anchor domain-containing protein n=1 Tax=Vagococcus allomyrinae TaxID=2794353 RepID=A0A940PCH8_9ENTE|nr:LPXTG cell wall anchor domain-containing protein [Vagococcus allomyrinae]MBP1040223.1 LPXTG cell wall anchor domain-containing protein [Vagococcus allomyrinae]
MNRILKWGVLAGSFLFLWGVKPSEISATEMDMQVTLEIEPASEESQSTVNNEVKQKVGAVLPQTNTKNSFLLSSMGILLLTTNAIGWVVKREVDQ